MHFHPKLMRAAQAELSLLRSHVAVTASCPLRRHKDRAASAAQELPTNSSKLFFYLVAQQRKRCLVPSCPAELPSSILQVLWEQTQSPALTPQAFHSAMEGLDSIRGTRTCMITGREIIPPSIPSPHTRAAASTEPSSQDRNSFALQVALGSPALRSPTRTFPQIQQLSMPRGNFPTLTQFIDQLPTKML